MAKKVLILTDGKPGHVNQSIAFARLLGFDYDLCRVRFRSRLAKGLSYLLAQAGLFLDGLFMAEPAATHYLAVVSAGSETYYANRTLAKNLRCKSVAIMLPKGYGYDFDLIVAQQHDNPPRRSNIHSLPVNLSYAEPQGVVAPEPGRRYVSLLIGGNSKHCALEPALLRRQFQQIRGLFPEHDFWLTTSRRTPADIEAVLREFSYARAVYYSQEPINPIPDFLRYSEYVFLTADSTSMISEAVSFGDACVEILPLAAPLRDADKFGRFLSRLHDHGCLHFFDGDLGRANRKIRLADRLREVVL